MAGRLALYVSEGRDLVHYSINADDGDVSRLGTVTAPAIVQYAWVHPSGRHLYAASSTGNRPGSINHLIAFDIAADGSLVQNGEPVPLVHRPIHLCVHAEGHYLLVAYNVPSMATVHRIGRDGRIGELVEQPHALEGGYYAHQIRVLPSGKAAVLVARGTHRPNQDSDPGSLHVYDFSDGVLSDAQAVAPYHDYGPRHLDFHPTKPWAYVSLEHQNQIHLYSIANDRFSSKPLFSSSILADPDNVRPRQLGATIQVHPDGRYVYVANRGLHTVPHDGRNVFGGGENSIAVFAIDQNSGEPRRVQLADPQAYNVRCFGLDPAGRILVTVSMMEMDVVEGGVVRRIPRAITVFRVGDDGRLSLMRKHDVDTGGKEQWWMKLVALPA